MNRLLQPLLRRYTSLHADHRRIATGAAWVAGFVVAGRLVGAAKEMGVAWRYGVSEVVDSYQLATTLVLWLPGTLVSVISIVLVPMLARLRHENQGARSAFFRELQGSAVLVGIVFGGVSVVGGPIVLPYFAGGISEASRHMVWQFTVGMAPLAPLTVMIGLYAARLMARERQVNTLLEGVPAAAILLLVLLWPPGADIAPLLWGTVLGIALQTFWLGRLAQRSDGEGTGLMFSRRSPYWPELYKAAGVMAVGQFVMSFVTPLDQYTAAKLGGGAIATLGYANRVIALVLGVGAVAISRAALPVMSDLHAHGQAARVRSLALKWAGLTLGIGIVIAAVAWMLAPWGIGLLFERGAFGAQDTGTVAEVFRFGVLQVPPFFCGLVLVQQLASRGRYRPIAVSGVVCLAVKAPLNMILSSVIGIAGITLATSLMYGVSLLCLACFSILLPERKEGS